MVKIERLDANKAVVRIYAYVGSWEFNAESFQNLLDDLADVQTIIIKLHSYGGNVFDGNVISNSARSAKQTIEVDIVGVAASMASIFTQAVKKVRIVENGFFMIHTPSGYTEGNASKHENGAKLLRSMEKQFIKDYTRRSGRKPEDTAKYLDGQDHWLDAEEALQAGFVSEIIPVEVEGPEELTVEAVAQLGPKAAFARFEACLTAEKPKPVNPQSQMKKGLIEKYGLKGVTADSSDAEVQAALDAHLEEEKKTANQSAEKVLEETATSMVTAEIGKKITAEQKAGLIDYGKKSGITALKTLLDGIQPSATITGMLGGGSPGGTAPTATKEGWDWDKYQAEAPKELEAMEKNNPEAFQALYKAKYSK